MVNLMFGEIISVIVKGGFIMIPLLGASLISVAVTISAFGIVSEAGLGQPNAITGGTQRR
jgi:hypothetical protein